MEIRVRVGDKVWGRRAIREGCQGSWVWAWMPVPRPKLVFLSFVLICFLDVGGPPRSLGPTRPHRPDRPAGDGPVSDGRDGLAGVPEAPCVMAGWGSCAAKDLQE